MIARFSRSISYSCSRKLSQSAVRRAVTNMQMPAMSPTMTEGGIASWKKKEGESFSAGDVLLEIETDKATIDVEAQEDGVLGKIIVPDGTKNVKIGKIIAMLAEEGDDITSLQPPAEDTEPSAAQAETATPPSPPPPGASPEPTAHHQPHSTEPISHSGPIFPSVHRLLAENGISDLGKITGTGVRGMVTKGDVLAFLGKASGPLGSFKPTPTPIEEALKGLQKKATPEATPLDGPALRRLIVSTMLQNSVKAKSIPVTAAGLDFDSVIADYSWSPAPSSAPMPGPCTSPVPYISLFLLFFHLPGLCDMGAVLCCCSEPVDFDGEINLYHFDLHRAVGRGAFGKVRVIEHKKTKKLYALKYVEKAQCIRQKAVANVVQERRLLEEIDHPFVVNMRYAFQDDENCFFVLDLMLGGDLRFHLDRKGPLSEEIVRFWLAQLASAVAYLHKQKIVHRDIKPDNVLLDSDGNAHLTDFNVAIHYSDRRPHTSVAGSMAYMAPEVLGRKGYSWQIDWWSLGITAYELLFNKRPFDGRSAERMTSSIAKDTLRFPSSVLLSADGTNALRQFIERDPSKRMGCRSPEDQLADLQQHPWFSSVDWEKLLDKELPAPFVPDMKHANFDVSHELDEFLMVEKPLTHSKRKANVDMEKLKPEMRQLEEQFTVYDFDHTRRQSYYPHNQLITSRIGESTILANSPTESQQLQPTATIAEPSRPASLECPPPLPDPLVASNSARASS
ncbi:hypothetical protein D9757_007183 [Collybiopsis confluens]|uniref:Kinase-like protein n=1 Tax=Collybiopsis confluens TaxID=2823264 RepID=A0A8H5M400_9AGAR|nr:hypothetical protein D9757_007183 [Collybiopsis confluens]